MSDNKDTITISLSLTNPPRRIPLELPSPAPSATLHKIASDATTIPLTSIRLIFRGKIIPSLEEGNVVESFKLEDGCVVHCMGKPAAPAANTSVPASSSVNSTGSVVTPPSTAAASSASASIATSNTLNGLNEKHPLTSALEGMKSHHSSSEYTTALNTISKILSNIISNPTEEKYRKVKRSNAAFTKRLGRLTKSHEAMTTIGFVSTKSPEGNDEYSIVPNAAAWNKLTSCKKIIDDLMQKNNQQNANNATNPNVAGMRNDMGFGATPPSTNNMSNIFPNMNNMGNLPTTPQMMESMLSNPAALQSMLSNPMVQNMVMNDPRMRNNPMMQNSMREMMNNPAMVQQMTQMMSNPNIRSRMNAMMQQQQQQQGIGASAFGGSGAGDNNNGSPDMAAQMEMMRQFANISSMTNTNQTNSAPSNPQTSNNSGIGNQQQEQQQQNNGNDSQGERQMTEEEMIAEAIARSMREQ